jgi:hypothetical protein
VSCREIVFEIYTYNISEPAWLQQARSDFNAALADAAKPCRQAVLMGLHPRWAADGCMIECWIVGPPSVAVPECCMCQRSADFVGSIVSKQLAPGASTCGH